MALAALVPGALIGWFVYEAVGAPGDSSGSAAGSTSSVSAGAPLSPSGTASNDDKPPGPSSLKGKVVVIDPGHNVTNFQHTAEINRKVNIGTNWKECDTTGTSTNAGYAEAQFTMDVSHRLKALLERQGVTVKLTHDGDSPAWGPCVDQRARIGNDAHADAAISIHADGAPVGDRGFHVILPGSVHAGPPTPAPSSPPPPPSAGASRATTVARRANSSPITSAKAPVSSRVRTWAVSICQRFPRCSSSAATCAIARMPHY